MLHLSKVAFSCASVETLERRQLKRVKDGVVPILTRFRPKRAAELLAGGSLYWIIRHRLVGRQAILDFATSKRDGRTIIRLEPALIRVDGRPMRAHQGWRYLEPGDAPADLEPDDPLAALPAPVAAELARLALI